VGGVTHSSPKGYIVGVYYYSIYPQLQTDHQGRYWGNGFQN
jgi:hypothetical protein